MANVNKANVIIAEIKQGVEGKYAKCIIEKKLHKSPILEVRVMMLGDSGAGKSTLIAAL